MQNMLRDDSFLLFLRTHPHIAGWLQEQMLLKQNSSTRRYTQPMPDPTLSVTGEFGAPVFTVSAPLDFLPCEAELRTLLAERNIVPKVSKVAGSVQFLGTPLDSASAFYLPGGFTKDGWALGMLITTDRLTMSTASLLGFTPDQGTRLDAAWFMASQKTGDSFDVLAMRDGRVLVVHDSHLNTQRIMTMYSPMKSNGKWGSALRTLCATSMLDCVVCCRVQKSRCWPSFCRCVHPQLPVAARPFDTWQDLSKMTCELVQDVLHLQKLYDQSGSLLASFIAYNPQVITHTTRDSLPLFQALVLNNEQFHVGIETQIFNHVAVTPLSTSSPSSKREASFEAPDTPRKRTRWLLLENSCGNTSPHKPRSKLQPRQSVHENSSGANSEGERPQAQLCGKAGSNRAFQCDQCGRQFNFAKNLKRHMLTVHGEARNFQCEQCCAQFKLVNSLNAHVRQVHNGERSHPCDLCPMRFWSSSNLKRHIHQAHLKTRAFSCDLCPKSFSSKYNLARHREQCMKKKITREHNVVIINRRADSPFKPPRSTSQHGSALK